MPESCPHLDARQLYRKSLEDRVGARQVRYIRVDAGPIAGRLFCELKPRGKRKSGFSSKGNIGTVVMQWMLLAIYVRD